MAIRSPTTAAELITFLTGGASDGDIIELADTTGFSDNRYNLTAERGTTAPLYITNSLTIRPAGGRGAYFSDPVGDGSAANASEFPWAFTRKTLIKGFLGVNGSLNKTLRMENIALHPGIWPNRGIDEKWATLPGAIGNQQGLIYGINTPTIPELIGVEAFVGEQTTAAAFDVTVRHPAANSPLIWYFVSGGQGSITNVDNATQAYNGWGDATWDTYSWIANMPTLFRSDGAGVKGVANWRDLYLHDMLGMAYITGPSSGTLEFEPKYGCMRRNYADFMQVQQNSNLAGRAKVKGPWGWIIEDPWGNFLDNANPHVDTHQDAITNANTNNSPNARMGKIFALKRPACRGDGSQVAFWQTSGTTPLRSQHESPRVNGVMAINQAKLIAITSGANVAIDRVIGVTTASNPWNASASGSVDINRINRSGFATADTVAYIDHATIESLSGDSRRFADPATYQKVTKGAAGAALNNFSLNVDTSSLHQIFEAFKTADPNKGVGNVTLRQFVNAPYDYSTMPKRLGIINLSNVAPATLITTDPLAPSGFNIGDSMTLTVSAGIEFQVLDLYTGSVLRAWGTSSFTYVDGSHLVQFRATSGALDSSFTGTISFGSTQFTWTIYTRSANQFPRAATPGSTRVWKSSTGLTGLTGPTTINQYSGWIRFRPKSITGTQYLVAMATGGNVQGPIMSGSQLGFLFRDAGAVTLLSYNLSSLFVVDQDIDIKWAFDPINGIYQLYINDVLRTPTSSTITGNAFYIGNQNWTMIANTSNGSGLAANTEFEIFFVAPLQFIDWSVDNRRLIAAQPNYLGPSGEGLTGTAPQIMMLGDAAAIEAGNANRGIGGAFVRNGTAITSINANSGIYTFPPNLKLAADPVTPTLVTLGQTLEIDVYPLGFAKAGVGFTRAVTGVTGTFDSASYTLPTTFDSDKGYGSSARRVVFTPTSLGAGQINFTPDSGYTAPSAVNFTVQAAPVVAGNALRQRSFVGVGMGFV